MAAPYGPSAAGCGPAGGRHHRNTHCAVRDGSYTVVTEHGVAELKYKSIDERAEALIEIADPSYRDHLQSDWREIRKSL